MSSPEALGLAAAELEAGGVVVIPTDTVYGIAARLDRPAAIEHLFEVKQRPRSKPIALLVADLENSRALGRFTDEALKRAGEWPGALTLVVESLSPLPALGGDGRTVGLRVPDHEWTARLLRECGPLATTSANPSGKQTSVTIGDVAGDLGDGPGLYIDGGPLSAPPSTVISFVGEPEVLR